jgi:hypothetical protein
MKHDIAIVLANDQNLLRFEGRQTKNSIEKNGKFNLLLVSL